MIGTIRKHSSWLWLIIITLTIISFLWWGASPASRYGNGRGGGFGTIYGKDVSPEAYAQGQREFYLYYWLHYGEFPDKTPGFNRTDMERETYIRLMLTQKAKDLGIHIGEQSVVAAANELLRSLGRGGAPVPMDQFVERVLQPENLTVADLQSFLRSDLTIQQLVQTLGLSGALVVPSEAGALYDREHQEISAQGVFFAASNYLAKVTVTPDAVAQFYTNNMAAYREPDRVQVNYVVFPVSNYVASAEQKIGKTNVTAQAEAYFNQHGQEAVPEAKTPAEAKAKIAEMIVRQGALAAAAEQAKAFVTALYAIDPVKAENLVTLAKQKGVPARITAPFAAATGPEEFNAPADFTKVAFKLNAESPFSKPLAGADAIYIIALAKQLPSTIPPLEQIRTRVTQDYRDRTAAALAQRAGTNFYFTAGVQMATGKTFAQAAVAAGQSPQVLTPFSLSSTEVPEAGDRVELGLLKQAAFTTPTNHLSNFVPTADGGFVLFVQSLLPLDEARKSADMPQFLSQIRRARQNEAFNLWLQSEANRELRNTPVYAELTGGKAQAAPAR